MSGGTADVTFIEIGNTRAPVYRAIVCREGHIHVRIRARGKPVIDLVFEKPHQAYDFAHAILRQYDVAEGIA